jgi:hypothetical protein
MKADRLLRLDLQGTDDEVLTLLCPTGSTT